MAGGRQPSISARSAYWTVSDVIYSIHADELEHAGYKKVMDFVSNFYFEISLFATFFNVYRG